jgi:hypothetical protein
MISAIPCRNKSTPVTGIRALRGNTGTPAGLKMLTSLNWTDIFAYPQPEYIQAPTAGRKKMT